MPAIIPAPALTHAASGTLTLPKTVRLAVDNVDLAGPLDDIITRVNSLDGYTAEVGTATPTEAGVNVRLVAAEPLFAELSDTHGLSPADRDPHDERYVIEVTESGIDVRAVAAEGLVRALSTLTQLILSGAQDGGVIAAQTIVDGPRFAWRGLSLDVVRTFFTPAQVKVVIDMLALHRMNVLHLHLTDSQGWRLEIPSLPKLTEIGGRGAVADRPGGFYSAAEYADIVDYAAARFVTIVPEVDVPGHTGAIFASYPELRSPELPPAEGPMPVEYLDPRMDATRTFLTEVFGYLATVTPGAYLHLGGDEAFGMPDELYAEFIRLVMPIVRDTGKKAIGWQEIARGELAPGDVAQYWISGLSDLDEIFQNLPPEMGVTEELKGRVAEQFRHASQDVAKAQAQGVGIVLSPTQLAYFDAPLAEASINPTQEARRAALGVPVYKPTSVVDSVRWELPEAVPEVDFDGVVGVEAAIWCETIQDETDLHMMLLPRLAGFAEKGWSAPNSAAWENYSTRLAAQGPLWRAADWGYFESSLVDWR